MSTIPLLSAVDEHECRERGLAESCLTVWAAVSEANPKLAAELLTILSYIPTTALWITTFQPELDASPARSIAQGREEKVLSLLRKSMGGFVA